MADHIDYAAEYLRSTLQYENRNGESHDVKDPDYPFVGLVILMFKSLAERGFHVVRDEGY